MNWCRVRIVPVRAAFDQRALFTARQVFVTEKRHAVLIIKQDWRSVAECQFADPDLFFPISSSGKALQQVAKAKEFCARCRVRRECLVFALLTHQRHGVWGGMSEEERHQLERAN